VNHSWRGQAGAGPWRGLEPEIQISDLSDSGPDADELTSMLRRILFSTALTFSLITGVCLVLQFEKSSGSTQSPNRRASIAMLAGEYFFGDGFVNLELKLNPDG
jgi:hypothetical protein